MACFSIPELSGSSESRMRMIRYGLIGACILWSQLGLAQTNTCKNTAYLTFDTGNMAVAEYIA
ncbi:MAG: hypothetical protein RLZZ539_792, partial [Pseudomonadota bacterium]